MTNILQFPILKTFVAISMVLTFTVGTMAPVVPVAWAADQSLELLLGDLETVPVNNLTRVSVTDPSIADITDAQSDKVVIMGKKAGQTVVFLWDNAGKRSVIVRVHNEDLNDVRDRIDAILSKTEYAKLVSLDVNKAEGRVIVSGNLTRKQKDDLDEILEPYQGSILNLTKEEVSEELVQIDMQVTDLSTTLVKNLGVEWKNGASDEAGQPLSFNYEETLPGDLDGARDWFKLGDINRSSQIMATVNALVQEGKARVLSKPRLVVVSGKEASFLVGGEVPIRTTTTSVGGSSSQENVSFKQYGVNMTITPTVRNGKVDVLLNVQISDIDASNENAEGDLAFITRQAQTQLYLEDGQTIVLAGLIKHSDGETIKKVPFLGSIPIIGLAFRNRKVPNNGDSELVISLTPRILKHKKYATKETVLPSPAGRALAAEVESHYEQEILPSKVKKNAVTTPAPASTPAVAPVVPAVAPLSAAPAETQVAQAKEEVTVPYARLIQEKISQGITYPYEALQNNWQGTVKLKLHILKDGTLANASVLETSGHEVFDRDALNTAKIAAPYPAFSADMTTEDLMVTIPIIYSQGALAKN